ncbi:MAG TPA: pyrroloquinoline quinone biosynthesis peptide chaperone PqqD [Verrucomicrobiae bacterium]|jgi:pyrroloquinoline quinone biosynthesis protein D|nr:pyrroloquinoline quinone biosynthesis peptide chaperone PqqD [Verrucomicrobiae bacterium]
MSAIADTVRPRLADKARLKWDAVRQKHLLLFPEGVLVLNQTAHAVLELCDGNRSVAEVVTILGERYKNDAIDSDVKEILEKLAGKNFVRLDA